MSDELRLPDDLAAMEARLAAHALPASNLNRDELMYRAGWAACEAAVARAPAAERPPAPSPRRIAAWSLASAALAASLAVVATMKVLSGDGAGVAVSGSSPRIAQATVAPSLHRPAQVNRSKDAAFRYVADVMSTRKTPLGGSIFAQRLQRMRDVDSRPAPDDSMAHGEPSPPPKTALELRQELMPRRAPSFGAGESALGWPWNVSLWGGST